MKSGKSFFQFPFVIISLEKYQKLIVATKDALILRDEKNEIIELERQKWMKIAMDLEKQLAKINLRRNAKGQFESRAKV